MRVGGARANQGKDAGAEYVISSRKGISNFKPIISGEYGVNRESSGDIYAKGANILHTLRQIVRDDELWRQTLRGLNKEFFHQSESGIVVENTLLTFDDLRIFDLR